MRIIKEGKLKENQFRFICKWCDCEWECADREVVKGFTKKNEFLYTYNCPTCGAETYGEMIRTRSGGEVAWPTGEPL